MQWTAGGGVGRSPVMERRVRREEAFGKTLGIVGGNFLVVGEAGLRDFPLRGLLQMPQQG